MEQPEVKPAPAESNQPKKQQERKGKNKKEDGDEKKGKGTLKTPKGTKDYEPSEMVIREEVMRIIVSVFKKHGAVTIETPLFELKETLTGKYGEDSKLIYDLQDQGGELCSLRYDLTVPFARYVAMNRIKQIKRYQIGRVYRRDNPVMTKGRYREFYQCDFDIAGEYDLMIPDAEVITIMKEILEAVGVGAFKIKLNHRKLLDGVLEICGVEKEKHRTICSSIDKLDKMSWEQVKNEMVTVKGLSADVADKIWSFVQLKGEPNTLLNKIETDKLCEGNESAAVALKELKLLFEYLEAYEALSAVELDLSLARGLDYYTGVIYEAVLDGESEVGSVAAGGRYDDLIGLLGNTKSIPAVGASIGIERIFAILEHRVQKNKIAIQASETEVFVVSADQGMLKERMKILSQLWKAGIKAETLPRADPKMKPQLNAANASSIPFALIFGKQELDAGTLQLKFLQLTEAEEKEGKPRQVTIPRADFTTEIRKRLDEYYAAHPKHKYLQASSKN